MVSNDNKDKWRIDTKNQPQIHLEESELDFKKLNQLHDEIQYSLPNENKWSKDTKN